MLIMNATCEEQSVRVFGNYFSLAPGKIKDFRDEIGHFMATDRAYMGFVALPDEFTDPDFKDTEEGKRILEEKRKSGVDARIKHLRSIIYNNEVSLRNDLDRSNIKADTRAYASEGEMAAYRELAKYQRAQEDITQRKVDEIAELQKVIKAN